MPPKKAMKREAEEVPDAADTPAPKTVRISPVDKWNTPGSHIREERNQSSKPAKTPPTRSTKRKSANTQDPAPKAPPPPEPFAISPVDAWNPNPTTTTGPLHKVHASHYLDLAQFTDIHGRRWEVARVKLQFRQPSYTDPKFEVQLVMEHGLPVSPKTVATFEQMNGVERERLAVWEEERERKLRDGEGWRKEFGSPFYEGFVRLYGRRGVP